MWCSQPPQIRHHQDRDVAVAPCLLVQFALAEYIAFYTVITIYNGSLAADITRIDVPTHERERNTELALRSF